MAERQPEHDLERLSQKAWTGANERRGAGRNAPDSGNVVVSARERGRHYDIIQEALETYRNYMLDDDFNAQLCLDTIIRRMRERMEMSDAPT